MRRTVAAIWPAAGGGVGEGALAGAPSRDTRRCAALVHRHARTFSLASRWLPLAKRRGAYALYATCRVADDLVDEATDRATARFNLNRFSRRLELALAGTPDDAVLREMQWAMRAFGIPRHALTALVSSVALDLETTTYDTWAQLEHYCQGVASTVAEMCTHVFGLASTPNASVSREHWDEALVYARTLGVAMQLTNILRDVGEDARRGRCYLPSEDLRRFELSREHVLAAPAPLARDPRWHRLMAFEIARARALYAAAQPGLSLLASDARQCATMCAYGYAAILDAIERNGFDTLTRRARPHVLARLAVLWTASRDARREVCS